MRWDPQTYRQFSDERNRPFFDLVIQIRADSPRLVVDLGCGPGDLTATLADRWPGAEVRGIDSSPEMITRAKPLERDRLRFTVGDVADWRMTPDVDVLVSNAVLHWVPGHQEMIARWAEAASPGTWIGWQVPGNFGAPSHVLMRELAGSAKWADRLGGVLRHREAVSEPAEDLALLGRAGFRADAWETTYLHVLRGPDAVLNWVRGTALRPVLGALDPAGAGAFEAEYAVLLREAYPETDQGTIFPFRRIFCVGEKA
jgi:trans-aconitate 2-methyltransferase